ncbi:calcium-activated chloride channel regulator 4A-like [Penaeus japonicus]|uniref:calcium-activated chloride channel regulator 4A-like n=1 Tax=Penaeus japonicus TaxID=27405 RepID=UPI001C711080|nr:calcium-activated chloride channel regulator 4A-like [Penaeus japonicus]XP_042884898.1 calcium-activated chloride channel regulator 4A-like [Penaeus japonicus]XP_042884900.1 calcium-activated chloride channel regulator 4A-like [Penaeus japonicus]XP_042884901.1 calcium-activated chloride channel regulator 4A-like [Penaeus japonicus]
MVGPMQAKAATVVVALVTLLAATGDFAAAEARVKLTDNGYDGVLVAISSSVDESYAQSIISSIKRTIGEASEVLFKATNQRAFFRDVKILLPSSWTNTPYDQVALNENFDESDIRVDVGTAVYRNQPHTEQPGGCGDPGLYIHLTPKYLISDNEADVWGPRSKVFVHEWAKYRWGVFDEFGYPDDEMYPLFYATTNIVEGEVEITVHPNYCANERLEGDLRDISGKECSYVDDLPDKNCRFVPDEKQVAVSSLMSFYYIANIEKFCDKTRRHNLRAPNKQNTKCDHRSVWAIIETHNDFKDDNNPPIPAPSPTKFTVLRQEEAKFALVLDYSYSMRDFDRIKKLQSTARRWILHEVAEGSSVGIIKFGGTAKVEAPLTVIQDESSRKALADLVDTNLRSATSIGAGLNLAVNSMLHGEKNAVILLITDGEENTSPYIRDIEDQLVASGIRVVTIAFGADADTQLESIALKTDGKTFTVLDTDTGSQLLDAFLGALTYQPGDTLADTKVKIYEYEYRGTDKLVSADFPVDNSVGRDMLFRLKTSAVKHTVSDPFLVRPDGTLLKTATFDPIISSWTISVPQAEVGKWTWKAELSGNENYYIQVDVTAKARTPDILPIFTRAWASSGSNGVDATVFPVIVYAEVKQGNNPVVGATVRAYVTHSSKPIEAQELDLLDNGQGADSQAGDGIYSRYLTNYPYTGRYIVKAQAWNNGSAFINNGFTVNRRHRRRHARAVPAEPLETPAYCCGSKVPFDGETVESAGEFSRYVSAGSIQVTKIPETGDVLPPSRVTDLRVIKTSFSNLTLTWTATGDDLDAGMVAGYEIRFSKNDSELVDPVYENTTILTFEDSKDKPELLVEAGENVTVTLALAEEIEVGTVYYLTLRAVDDIGKMSSLSNVATAFVPNDPVEEGLSLWLWVSVVAGIVVVIAVIACVVLSRRRKGIRVPQENPDW